jgi:hypothetical protein
VTFFADETPPLVDIIYPLGNNIKQNTTVAIALNITDLSDIDLVRANISSPNGTNYIVDDVKINFATDFFDNDTLGTIWEFRNDSVASGHSCSSDINGTLEGKLFLEINGSASSGSTYCGVSSIDHLHGDFDVNISFNATYMEDDTFFVFRVNNKKELFSAGARLFISLRQTGGERQYRFATIDSLGINLTAVDTDDTFGKLRIKKTNSTGTPLFDAYYWNNSNNSWVNVISQRPMDDASNSQYAHIYLESSETNLGAINASVDGFFVEADDFLFLDFNETSQSGLYNVSVFVNDTLGYFNDTENTTFNVVAENTPPYAPIITTPSPDETVSGIINITWGPIIDDENDSLQFNITLLNPNESDNATIVSNYGNKDTIRYEWDTNTHLDGEYNLKVTVFENETTEGYSNFGVLTNTFTIYNNNTCTYTGGNWEINCSDNCVLGSNVDVLGNNVSVVGVGSFTIDGFNVSNFTDLHIEGVDSSNKCNVYCLNGGCFV